MVFESNLLHVYISKMPTFKLPCGKILTGQAAADAEKKQKKEEKEAKKALEKKKVEALKAGDADAAWAAECDLSSSNAAGGGRISGAEKFQEEVLNEIRANPSAYYYYRVRQTDWKKDADEVDEYLRRSLGYSGKGKASSGASGRYQLFTGVRQWTDEKLRKMYDDTVVGHRYAKHEAFEEFALSHRQFSIHEVHPSLQRKSGKAAIEIPDRALVAVRIESGTAHGVKSVSGVPGSRLLELVDFSISHSYICALIPPEMEALCYE